MDRMSDQQLLEARTILSGDAGPVIRSLTRCGQLTAGTVMEIHAEIASFTGIASGSSPARE